MMLHIVNFGIFCERIRGGLLKALSEGTELFTTRPSLCPLMSWDGNTVAKESSPERLFLRASSTRKGMKSEMPSLP